jgi:lipopolysaccharide export system protein LptC
MQELFDKKPQGAGSGFQKIYQRMSWIKRIFIILALCVVAIVIALPFLNPMEDDFRLTFEQLSVDNDQGVPMMLNPRFQGVDGKGQPYTLTAKEATNVQADVMDLNTVQADIQQEGGEWVYVMSNTAKYHKAKNVIELFGDVNILATSGYEFRSQYLKLNIKKQIAFTDKKVEGQGPLGIITSEQMTILRGGEYLRFKKDVKLTLFLSKG